MSDKPLITIEDGKRWLNEHFMEGVNCPTCSRYVKCEKRTLNKNIAAFMTDLVFLSDFGKTWIHYSRCRFRGRDYPDAAYHGLAIKASKETNTTPYRGYWLPTQKGIDFVMGKIKVPQYIFVYNKDIKGVSQEKIYIHETKNFDLQAMMNSWKRKLD